MTGATLDSYLSAVNGVPNSSLHVADRGLAYGDGLFETMRLQNDKIVLLERHLSRLKLGCERLFIPFDESLTRRYLLSFQQYIHKTNITNPSGIVKLILTRGQGGVGYAPPQIEQTQPATILQFTPQVFESCNEASGVTLHLCPHRLGFNHSLAGIKHLNRLEYVMAARELPLDSQNQGLLLDESDCVIETLQHNLFLVKAGQLITPKLNRCGVAGVMRGLILDELYLQLNLSAENTEEDITLEQLLSADEVFVSNSVRGVWHVASACGQSWHKGPIVKQLQSQLKHMWSDTYDS